MPIKRRIPKARAKLPLVIEALIARTHIVDNEENRQLLLDAYFFNDFPDILTPLDRARAIDIINGWDYQKKLAEQIAKDGDS